MSEPLVSEVDFIGLPTHDLEAAVDFYGNALGLRRSVYRPDRHHAEFETGNLTLNILNAEAMGLEHTVNRNPIALRVQDVSQARAARGGVRR